jgi:glutathione S-transferase
MLPWTALSTLCIAFLMFALAANVGVARIRCGIKAPAVIGHPRFERAYRIQLNTLEWALPLLPCLWIFAAFVADRWAAALGLAWVLARTGYAFAYMREPASRSRWFLANSLVFAALGLGALWGVLRHLWILSAMAAT